MLEDILSSEELDLRLSKKQDISYVLCHGWGASPSFWDPLTPFLDHYVLWDLGYHASSSPSFPIPQTKRKIVGIGHSLGFVRLLQSRYPFDALIGLQTFTRFLPETTGLLKAFHKDPFKTLKFFLKTSGISVQENIYNYEKLLEDLEDLKTIDLGKQLPKPYLILASQNDPIIPLENILQQFEHVNIYPHGLHNLPGTAPKWCVEKIINVVQSLL